ncbi:MAG: GNAT family N-acetyltransferase [Aggregatilineales bacterium]
MRGEQIGDLHITRYQRRNRHGVRELTAHNYYAHVHLDWQETDQWLDEEAVPIRLAWQHGRLIGVLATSAPFQQTSWIRLAAVRDHHDADWVLKALWDDIKVELRALGVHTVAWLLVRDWPMPFAEQLGFYPTEEIVTLRRSDQSAPPDMTNETLLIRLSREEDLPLMAAVDQAAFGPPWQMTLRELRQAERSAAHCTVAERHGLIVGYQISTLYFDGSHLARLAVAPAEQGHGVGSQLLGEALRYFARRGVYTTTVNTQASNLISQRLYLRFGFRHNGFNLPVLTAHL